MGEAKQSHPNNKRAQQNLPDLSFEENNWEAQQIPDINRKKSSSSGSKPQSEADVKKSRKFRHRTRRNSNADEEIPMDDSAIPVPHATLPNSRFANAADAQDLRDSIADSPPSVRTDPAAIYSSLPSAKFYDTKLYPSHHMSVQEIDQELKDLEAKREENHTTMSDILADHLKRINGTDYINKLVASNKHAASSHISLPSNQTTDQSGSASTTDREETTASSHEKGIAPIANLGSDSIHFMALPTASAHSALEQLETANTGEEIPRYSERVIPDISTASHQFLDVVDIDKRAFGMGPIQGIEQHARRVEMRKGRSVSIFPIPEPTKSEHLQPSKPEGRGMHARLEALSDQLDQLEQSAQALQHDLAFSVKVVNNVNIGKYEPPLSTETLPDSTSLVPQAGIPLSSHVALNNPTSPLFSTSKASPLTTSHLINQHTQQRIYDAYDLAGLPSGDSTCGGASANVSGPNRTRRSMGGDWLLPAANSLSTSQIQTLTMDVDWQDVEKILQE